MTVPTRPKVYSLYPLEPSVLAYARQFFDLIPYDAPNIEDWYHDADAIMARTTVITAEDVKRIGSKLKFIGKHGVGVDNLPLKELAEKGVVVMNTPGVNSTAVAELTLGLVLALARDIPTIDRRIRSGETVTKLQGGLRGFQITGKVFGIVGGGNIGIKFASMIYGAFKSQIYLLDPYLSPAAEERWKRLIPSTHLIRVISLAEMLPIVDVLSLHVPLLDSTRDMIGEEELKMMKPTALLINVARGGVVNEVDLAKALKLGWIMGAGVDAWADEPPTIDKYASLVSHDRVISLPHVGAAFSDIVNLTAMAVVDHVAEALSNQPLRDICVYQP